MTDADRYGGYTPLRATRFYIPLLLQAFSQSLTYPLVASIVSHGSLGVDALTAFAQGQTVMFMIGALGGGLVMTGMVFARTLSGYRNFIRLNNLMMAVLLSVQVLLALPPFDCLIFAGLLNLPPHLASIAQETMLFGVVMQGAFFLRNIPIVALFNARASFEANLATIVRVVLCAVFPFAFIPLGLVGPRWGLAALTIPCIVEWLLSHLFARRFVRKLKDGGVANECGVGTQFKFTLPLSFGGFLMASAPFMVAFFVGRSIDSVAMLAIHYVTIGLANPVAYGALRMQAVAIQFPPEFPNDHRIFKFVAVAGLILGLIPLAAAHPSLCRWYFHTVQNIPSNNITLAQIVIACYALWPILQTFRGFAEGAAARLKRPRAILFAQIAYIASMTLVLWLLMLLHTPGWIMALIAIFTATASALAVVSLQLYLRRK